MQSIEHICDKLIRSADRVLACVEDMRNHATMFPTPNGGQLADARRAAGLERIES
jgi:hypothetical protein